jgi:hypothetical protein
MRTVEVGSKRVSLRVDAGWCRWVQRKAEILFSDLVQVLFLFLLIGGQDAAD